MSIVRHFLNEFRPFFRMLDEPLARSSVGSGRSRSLFDDPFLSLTREMLRGPAVDVSETRNTYVVEVELPGVKKENLEVRIGDGGRSLTIEGKILASKEPGENNASEGMFRLHNSPTSMPTCDIATGETSIPVSTERSAIRSFTRTVFLPRPVDSSSVVAKLEDGILKLTLNKMEDKASVAVRVG
ncbi:SHSP domain-containing protein [Mycena venus]|uniref:SHSP domain-containing protein n=1 Tax=Mycena venus TaxID=2733690 RepID=A0A8H7CGG8_9AGAR|nr:SHSP domain-containing protein [Mycena venus]